METISFKPQNKLLKKWIDIFMNLDDIYFFSEKPNIKLLENHIISYSEYESKYSDFEYLNLYENWNLKKKAKYALIDKEGVISKLSTSELESVIHEQVLINRGYTVSILKEDLLDEVIKKFIDQDQIVLSHYLLQTLSSDKKKTLLLRYMQSIDDWWGYLVSSNLDNDLKKISNTFCEEHGTNCLAVTAYAITKNDCYLNKQVGEQEFIDILKKNLYYKIEDDNWKEKDIAVFLEDNRVVHACYCIKNHIFINKSGQNKLNPIVVLLMKDIVKDWPDCKLVHLRMKNENKS